MSLIVFTKPKTILKASGLLIVAISAATILLWRNYQDPVFNGKTASEWLDEALASRSTVSVSGPSVKLSSGYVILAPSKIPNHNDAFKAMEGDAVPFLKRWVNSKPSGFDKVYANLFQHLPASARRALPKPRGEMYFVEREREALMALGEIGQLQQWKRDMGEAVTKTPASLAIPSILQALKGTNSQYRTDSTVMITTLGMMGPTASNAVPDLIQFVNQNVDFKSSLEWRSRVAVEALEKIGPAASNSVELLAKIATSKSAARVEAASALGGIGPAAASAGPILAVLLSDDDPRMRYTAARSLGEIGVVPDGAVPILVNMRKDSNLSQNVKAIALFALWSRDSSDEQLEAELAAFLRSSQDTSFLVRSLARGGSKTAPFLPELEALTGDSDFHTKRWAKTAVQRIQSLSR